MDNQQPLLPLVLTVAPEQLPLFTTVLQSGIEITTPAGTSLGQFLGALPGFTAAYLADAVQTIFHNGTAIDDLTTILSGDRPVLALSSAMPGLAGAIFRKNSFHAALRSDIKTAETASPQAKTLAVTLKLFNSIALDRGKELLARGVRLPAQTLANFFRIRPGLLQAIEAIQLDGKNIESPAMLRALALPTKIDLKILDKTAGTNG
jgi:hypothetical protein